MVPFGAMTTACTYFVLFSRFGNRIFAMDGICSHKLVYLCNGLLMGGAVACPKHSANFDDRTAPACTNLKTWPVKMQDGAVHIEI